MSSAASAKHRYAKTLNDLAKCGLEPTDPDVRQQYDDFKLNVTKQALKILKERIPAKILYFNEQVNVMAAPGDLLHSRDLTVFARPKVTSCNNKECQKQYDSLKKESEVETNTSNSTADEQQFQSRALKRARTNSNEKNDDANCSLGAPHTCGIFNDFGEPHPGAKKQLCYIEPIPLNLQIAEMGERVRKDALELIEMVGVVRLWIQLNVPRIEDGNNFGVAIQEEAIQELGRVEDAAFNLCDGVKYHMTRAKLVTKVLKYPNVEDYVQSVVEVDRKEWVHLKVSLVDMRNSYSMLYDLLHKNWEKVVKPRTGEGNNLMVM